jgi:hypothetical protein
MNMEHVVKTSQGQVKKIEKVLPNGNVLISSAWPGGVVVSFKGKRTFANMKSMLTGKFRTVEIWTTENV